MESGRISSPSSFHIYKYMWVLLCIEIGSYCSVQNGNTAIYFKTCSCKYFKEQSNRRVRIKTLPYFNTFKSHVLGPDFVQKNHILLVPTFTNIRGTEYLRKHASSLVVILAKQIIIIKNSDSDESLIYVISKYSVEKFLLFSIKISPLSIVSTRTNLVSTFVGSGTIYYHITYFYIPNMISIEEIYRQTF